MRLSELLKLKQNRIRLDKIRNNRRNIVPFVGAGISVACGLFSWSQLLDMLAAEYLTSLERKKYEKTEEYMQYAQAIVDASGNVDAIMRRIAELIEASTIKLTKAPFLLVSSFSNNIVTTNYDTILEEASKKIGNRDRCEVLLPCLSGQMTAAIQENKPCIMKMHGSVEEVSSIIFTESQYNEFYGEIGKESNKMLPIFLETIFSGKSVLFVGCSLMKDRTMDILAHCLNRNKKVKHYAIVELPEDEDEEIEQRNHLASLGIEPIYFPKGHYESIDLLLEYLAEDNSFIKEAKVILDAFFVQNKMDLNSDIYNIIIAMLNESYYSTARKFPELFEINNESLNIVGDYGARIKESDNISESLYHTCLHMFNSLSKMGLRAAQDIHSSLVECFAEAALRETDIREVLQKYIKIYEPKTLDIAGKTDIELTILADELNRKIQFENEMSFRNFVDYYYQAVDLLDMACERIELRQRVLLCNTVGAWGTYVLDSRNAKKYLECAIETMESLNETEKSYSVLSQCYCNLGLLMAGLNKYKKAIECAEKDIECKSKININARLFAGSLGHYGLYQKELDPFLALQTHVDTVNLKRNNIDYSDALRFERDKNVGTEEMRRKLIASWATSVFDIGLLAKDMMLYEVSSKFILLANKYRYKILDPINKDYNASLNVEAELDVLLLKKQDINKYIDAVEGRVRMNPKLSTTIYHSWYVCALYFFSHEDYISAKRYIRKFKQEYYFKDDVRDTRQEIRAQLLEVQVLLKSNSQVTDAQAVLDDVISKIRTKYGDDSFWLVEPYTLYSYISQKYNGKLIELKNIYISKREKAATILEKFFCEIIASEPVME